MGSPLVDTARFLDTAHQNTCKRLVAGLGFQVSPFQLLVGSVFNLMPKPTLTNSGFRLRAVALAASCGVLLVGCGGGSVTINNQMPEPTPAEIALDNAHTALGTALAATLNTKEALDAANAAHKALTDAIAAAVNVSPADKAEYETAAAIAMGRIASAQRIFDAAETARMAMDEAAAAEREADLAAKLYAGITRNSLAQTSYSTNAGTMGDLQVRFDVNGDSFNGGNPAADDGFGDQSEDAFLPEDKDVDVAGLHGWEGMRYTTSEPIVIAGNSKPGTYRGTYEAMVWSKIGEPKEGKKFSAEYDSTVFTGGTLNEATTEGTPGRVAGSRFDHKAGLKRFGLPDPNPRGETIVTVPGSYHGVAGTYSCTPGAGSTCAASLRRGGEPGFNLGGVDAAGFAATKAVWTFRPADANARVMSPGNTPYLSYGWWLHTAEGGRLTASTFTLSKTTDGATASERNAERNALVARIPHNALYGTATYVGGAAGQYALASPLGGTNDAGAFTARATLKAAFNDGSFQFSSGSITGTIDGFTGADGEARDWEVELKKISISGTGFARIDRNDRPTVWTIGDTAAGASGNWKGGFYEAGDDDVPKVVTGTFRTEYGGDGIMVGAFGTDKQE